MCFMWSFCLPICLSVHQSVSYLSLPLRTFDSDRYCWLHLMRRPKDTKFFQSIRSGKITQTLFSLSPRAATWTQLFLVPSCLPRLTSQHACSWKPPQSLRLHQAEGMTLALGANSAEKAVGTVLLGVVSNLKQIQAKPGIMSFTHLKPVIY